MADITQLLFTGNKAPQQRQIITGMVSRNQPLPASFDAPLHVTLPNWSSDYYYALTNWPAIHGGTLPAAGAEVVLVRDDTNQLRLIWWDGAYSAAHPWIAPTLGNSWANLASPNAPVGYYKDSDGIVHLRGRASGGASATLMFTLPAGYRPATVDFYPCAAYTGSAPVAGFVNIDLLGGVTVAYAAGATSVGLGGITLLAED